MKNAIVTLALLTACGDNTQPLTWGAISTRMAEAYCSASQECGQRLDVPVCEAHVAWHMCEPEHACDTEVAPEADLAMDRCAEDLAELSASATAQACYYLVVWGHLPGACNAVWEYRP